MNAGNKRCCWVETSQGWVAGEITHSLDCVVASIAIHLTEPLEQFSFIKEQFEMPARTKKFAVGDYARHTGHQFEFGKVVGVSEIVVGAERLNYIWVVVENTKGGPQTFRFDECEKLNSPKNALVIA